MGNCTSSNPADTRSSSNAAGGGGIQRTMTMKHNTKHTKGDEAAAAAVGDGTARTLSPTTASSSSTPSRANAVMTFSAPKTPLTDGEEHAPAAATHHHHANHTTHDDHHHHVHHATHAHAHPVLTLTLGDASDGTGVPASRPQSSAIRAPVSTSHAAPASVGGFSNTPTAVHRSLLNIPIDDHSGMLGLPAGSPMFESVGSGTSAGLSSTSMMKKRSSIRGSVKRDIPPKSIPQQLPRRRSVSQAGHAHHGGLLGSSASEGKLANSQPHSPAIHFIPGTGDHVGVVGSSFAHLHDNHHHHHAHVHTTNGDLDASSDASTLVIHSDLSMPNHGVDSPMNGSAFPLPHHPGSAGHSHGHGHGHAGTPNGSARRASSSHRKVRRRTSHKGLLSRLALQFPAIKTSFQKVHQVFKHTHQERLARLADAAVARMASSDEQATTTTAGSAGSNVRKLAANGAAAAVAGKASSNGKRVADAPGERASFVSANASDDVRPMTSPSLPASPSALGSTLPPGPPTQSRGVSENGQPRTSSAPISLQVTEAIALDKLRAVFEVASCSSRTYSDAELCVLFKQPNLDASRTISFRDFLVNLALGYFLLDELAAASAASAVSAAGALGASNLDATTPAARASHIVPTDGSEFGVTKKGFVLVHKAFIDIDEDGSKSVDVSEMKRALFATSEMTDPQILEARFKELDFNGDGDISLPEFMYGFMSWVDMLNTDDDDE